MSALDQGMFKWGSRVPGSGELAELIEESAMTQTEAVERLRSMRAVGKDLPDRLTLIAYDDEYVPIDAVHDINVAPLTMREASRLALEAAGYSATPLPKDPATEDPNRCGNRLARFLGYSETQLPEDAEDRFSRGQEPPIEPYLGETRPEHRGKTVELGKVLQRALVNGTFDAPA